MRATENEKAHRRLEDLAGARTVLLTTYRRDGSAVDTPVHIAVQDGRAFVRTFDRAGKVKRLRRNAQVAVAPCTMLGSVTGPPVRAKARILRGDEAVRARRAIERKYPVIHGVLVPLAHRLRHYRTIHLELTD
jgi:PPOX class probable F420-dependent enzyme